MPDPAIDSVSDRLEREIAELFVENRLIGASVGLVRDQELVWSRGFGFADLESGSVPDQNTIFRVASNTKTFTATAIMQLRDEGKLNIDDPLTKYVPEFASVKPTKASVDAVTERELFDGIRSAARGRTTLVISQRAQTTEAAPPRFLRGRIPPTASYFCSLSISAESPTATRNCVCATFGSWMRWRRVPRPSSTTCSASFHPR